MFDQLIDEVNYKIWLLLPLKDRLTLLLLNKKINACFRKYLYKNLYLNTHKIITKNATNLEYTGEFSSYSFLAVAKNQSRDFIKTMNSMKSLIRSLENNPILLTYLEKIIISWHIPVLYKSKIVDMIAYGIQENGILYQPRDFKSLDNEMNKDLFLKFITNSKPSMLNKQVNLTIPHYDDKKGVNENDYFNGPKIHEDEAYYKQIGLFFLNNFIKDTKFQHLQSLDIHFNPISMGFCKNLHLNLKSLNLNIRLPDKLYMPQNYEYGDLTLKPDFKWENFLNVNTLECLDLVSWIPDPSTKYLEDYKLMDLLKIANNLKSLHTYSIPYDPKLMKYVLSEMTSLKDLRIDILDLTFDFTNLFLRILQEDPNKKFKNLGKTLKALHIELLPSSYRDPDFLIQLLRNVPNFQQIRSVLPCICKDCVQCLKTVINNRIFHDDYNEPHFDEEGNIPDSYENIHILFKKLNSITPYKSNYKNLFFQYAVFDYAQLKKNFDWEYGVRLTDDELYSLYQFMLHFYKRSINFMKMNFPKLEYLNINDLSLERKALDEPFEMSFPFNKK